MGAAQGLRCAARADPATSPQAPKTTVNTSPARGYNGIENRSISASYQNISSPNQSPSPGRAHGRRVFSHPQTPNQPLVRVGEQGWASKQGLKVRLSNLPSGCGTREILQALWSFGNIVRVEVQPGAAYVDFRPPPPQQSFSAKYIIITNIAVRVDVLSLRIFTVPSPINPFKTYNESNILYGNAIDFGLRVGDTRMMKMLTAGAQSRVQVMLNLKRKEMDIKFPLTIDGKERQYRFQLPISLLDRMYTVPDTRTDQVVLIIPANSPPQFCREVERKEIHKTCKPSEKTWLEWNAWYRQTDVVTCETELRMKNEPISNHTDSAVLNIGRWTTYRVSFSPSTLTGAQFEEFVAALTDHGISILDRAEYSIVEKATCPLWTSVEEEHISRSLRPKDDSSLSAVDDLFTGQIHLSFPLRYQLEVCLTNGYLKEHNVSRPFLERLTAMKPEDAIYILEKVAVDQIIYYDTMEIFKIPIKTKPAKKMPNYCALTRAVNVTPTMIHVATPVVETSNRIIRKFSGDAERFLRVKFSDEKTEGKINENRSDKVFERIQRAMDHGIIVAGRFYEFLAFGNSQFRENGAYFFAPTTSLNANDIRLTMGSFEHIKTVAKYGARLGQCFSTTRAIKSPGKDFVLKTIPDIARNGYTFTDGVGKLSTFVAQMAAQELGLQNPFDDPPSLYQFRLAGCKGVLAVDPELVGPEIHIRPSQYKFDAKHEGLEIIRASSFATACFNRQLIVILSTLGVPDYKFIKKQQEMVNYLERATTEQEVALERLQRNIDFNQTTLAMAGMILDGFMKSRDPFMMSLIQLWRAFNIKALKEKARISIDKGAFVLGCVDEYEKLQGHFSKIQDREGLSGEQKLEILPEIFLQISDPEHQGRYKVVEGICILARNPSLHPGDIRVVRAVDVKELHHMKNVVVLPQTGDRDLANMCSGGDLDGDDYLVMWDDDFIPRDINEQPMDFTLEKPVEKAKIEIPHDIAEFFVTYMKNDSLSRIALAHLAQVDLCAEGARSGECLKLARLHSQAVDYPKSGIPAIMERELKPRKWPHFMENKYSRTGDKLYRSKKIVGMLYDQILLVDFKPQYQNPFDSRILNAYQLGDEILARAAAIKDDYDSGLRRLMAKHDIGTEFEAWSVFALSHSQERNDYKFAEEFGNIIKAFKDSFRDICREAAAQDGILRFVAAMYTVTAKEMEAALAECRIAKVVGGQDVPVRNMDPEHMPLMSFPWLFVSELGKIATGDTTTPSRYMLPLNYGQAAKKPKQLADLEPQIVDIETNEGVTHYGELLKLDFGPTPLVERPVHPSGDQLNRKVQEKMSYDDAGHQNDVSSAKG
ncbi:RNA dependent RNA polymerase-domain-containing protein [Clohesyomyces aquaticus]|uniref:RNA-dependent RNA polymerase n=1 Tax=Clohesyomyces aquaticus TaxID=1231657 RepID=A0A1Y1ZMN7_9PLEO|nr:RNA dependent RNA polymerase-domain-containing protein [Clohesyomyces aquaticus]